MNKQYSVKEMADLHGVTPRTLRYYDEEGLLRAKRNEQQHRIYTKEDGVHLDCILLCKQIGMSNEEVKQFLYEKGDRALLLQYVKTKRKQLKQEVKEDQVKLEEFVSLQEAYMDGTIKTLDNVPQRSIHPTTNAKSIYSFWNVVHAITYARVLMVIFLFIDALFVVTAIVSILQGISYLF